MVVELTFADTTESCCETSEPYGHDWNCSDLVCSVDVLSIDARFLTSLSQHLYGGNALQMQYKNYNTSFFSVLSVATQLTHSRAASRLNFVFLTFAKRNRPTGRHRTHFLCPRHMR